MTHFYENDKVQLTPEEKKAIKGLQKAVDALPPTLWLVNNGDMTVMKFKEDGTRATDGCSVDSDYAVADILGVVSEGGDW